MDRLTVSETYTNNGFTIKAYDLNASRPDFSVAQRLSGISPECPKTATMEAYLDDATTLEVAFQGSAPVAFLIAGDFEDGTDEHICPENHAAFRQTVGAPAPKPETKPAPEKKGFFKGMLDKARGLAKKEAVEADNHAKEVNKKADDVDKAIAEVEKKLSDLKTVAKKGGKSSRVNRKTRRSKGKRRYTKRR